MHWWIETSIFSIHNSSLEKARLSFQIGWQIDIGMVQSKANLDSDNLNSQNWCSKETRRLEVEGYQCFYNIHRSLPSSIFYSSLYQSHIGLCFSKSNRTLSKLLLSKSNLIFMDLFWIVSVSLWLDCVDYWLSTVYEDSMQTEA